MRAVRGSGRGHESRASTPRTRTRCARHWVLALLAFGFGLTPSMRPAVAATDCRLPPPRYPLAQVTISLSRPPGRAPGGASRITISGDGRVSATHGRDTEPRSSARTLSAEKLIDLLNAFYRVHFFEMVDSHGVDRTVQLGPAGMVETLATKWMDRGGKRLCVELGDYRKCVTIVQGRPVEAARLAERIEGLAGKE